MKSFRTLYFAYVISILMLCCWGAHAWFTWAFENYSVLLGVLTIISGICWLYRVQNGIPLRKNIGVWLALLMVVLARMLESGGGIHPKDIYLGLVLFYPLWIILSDQDGTASVLDTVDKILAVVLIPGILLHVVMLVVGKLPSVVIRNSQSILYEFYNYGVLLKSCTEYEESGIRFQSWFLEPGYCGTLLAFLLYAARYDWKKWQNVVILIALFFTLSLAGIVATVVGYVLYSWSCRKSIAIYIVGVLLLGIVWIVGRTYNSGDNVLNQMVLERFLPDEDTGDSRNRRNSEAADLLFAHMFTTGEWLHGVGAQQVDNQNGESLTSEVVDYTNQIRGAGYKMYMIYHGVLSVIVAFLIYLFLGPAQVGWSNRYIWGFVILIVLIFIPTSYPLSHSWLVPFTLAAASEGSHHDPSPDGEGREEF